MNAVMDRIRAEFATTSRVRQAAERWQDLSDEYYRHPCHSEERRRVGAQIAGCLQVIADGWRRRGWRRGSGSWATRTICVTVWTGGVTAPRTTGSFARTSRSD